MKDEMITHYNQIIDYVEKANWDENLSWKEAYEYAKGYIKALMINNIISLEDYCELHEEIVDVLIGMYCRNDT